MTTLADKLLRRSTEQALYKEAIAYVWLRLKRLGVPARDRADLAHQVLAAAYTKRHEYDPRRGPLAPWLHGFVVNVARNYRRKHAEEPQSLDFLPESSAPASTGRDPEAHAEQGEFLVEVLFSKVPFDQRAVVLARDLDDLDFQDIAQLHGIPLSTAYDRYARGRAALEKACARWNRDEQLRRPGMVPFALGALLEADRAIPPAPAEVERAVAARLEETRARLEPRDRRWRRFAAHAVSWLGGMIAGAALVLVAQREPEARVSVVEVPPVSPTVAAAPNAETPPSARREPVAEAPLVADLPVTTSTDPLASRATVPSAAPENLEAEWQAIRDARALLRGKPPAPDAALEVLKRVHHEQLREVRAQLRREAEALKRAGEGPGR
ncbi:MAG: sigma factor-like helix-turn-helix DNA-binding protein [Byssovorax sp.]